jgi:hypothetical protein
VDRWNTQAAGLRPTATRPGNNRSGAECDGLVDALIAEGEAATPLGLSDAYQSATSTARRAAAASGSAAPRRDLPAAVLALRREAPGYGKLPARCAPGARRRPARPAVLNDFGWMEPDGTGHDTTAAQALLDLGTRARPLVRCFDDERPRRSRSETATMSSAYATGRADFAARYLNKLLRRDAPLPPSWRSATRRSPRFAKSSRVSGHS